MNSNGNVVFSAFRDLVRKRVPEESCDLCSAPLDSRHAHLLDVAQRQVMCACTPCAVLFTDSMTRFRRIPRDVRHLPDCRLTDEHWAALGIPVDQVKNVIAEAKNLRPLVNWPNANPNTGPS